MLCYGFVYLCSGPFLCRLFRSVHRVVRSSYVTDFHKAVSLFDSYPICRFVFCVSPLHMSAFPGFSGFGRCLDFGVASPYFKYPISFWMIVFWSPCVRQGNCVWVFFHLHPKADTISSCNLFFCQITLDCCLLLLPGRVCLPSYPFSSPFLSLFIRLFLLKANSSCRLFFFFEFPVLIVSSLASHPLQ